MKFRLSLSGRRRTPTSALLVASVLGLAAAFALPGCVDPGGSVAERKFAPASPETLKDRSTLIIGRWRIVPTPEQEEEFAQMRQAGMTPPDMAIYVYDDGRFEMHGWSNSEKMFAEGTYKYHDHKIVFIPSVSHGLAKEKDAKLMSVEGQVSDDVKHIISDAFILEKEISYVQTGP